MIRNMKYLLGKPVAEKILQQLQKEIHELPIQPTLAVLLAGDNAASQLYVNLKKQAAQKIGIRFVLRHIPEESTQEEAIAIIKKFNDSPEIHGILIQLPLPKHLDKEAILTAIRPEKDVDGLNKNTPDALALKQFLSPFPQAIMHLIESSGCYLSGKNACILANSLGFGLAMKKILSSHSISSSVILHEALKDNIEMLRTSDILITALGIPGSIQGDFIKNGAIVIDGGIEKVNGKICGDVNENSVSEKVAFLSPVPGGVGPLTVACLMKNVIFAAKNSMR